MQRTWTKQFWGWENTLHKQLPEIKRDQVKEAQDRDNNKIPYQQNPRQNKRNRDDQQHIGYNPRKGYANPKQGYQGHAAGIEDQDNFHMDKSVLNDNDKDISEHVEPYNDNNSNDDTDKTPEINNSENNNYVDNRTEDNYIGAAIMNEESQSDQEEDYQ